MEFATVTNTPPQAIRMKACHNWLKKDKSSYEKTNRVFKRNDKKIAQGQNAWIALSNEVSSLPQHKRNVAWVPIQNNLILFRISNKLEA